MSNQEIFVKPPEDYQRNLNLVAEYIEQASYYLSKSKGLDIEWCRKYVKGIIAEKRFPTIRNPTVTFFYRLDNGDREVRKLPLSRYLNEVIAHNEILAPTFTTYLHPKDKSSVLVGHVVNNKKLRNKTKQAAFQAKAAGDYIQAKNLDIQQVNYKLGNNILSGVFGVLGGVLSNKTAHSTLTSTTRCVGTYGTSSNEKIITGTRHYWSPAIVMNNIISIITHTDYKALQAIIDKYNLIYPSVEDSLECIKYSSNFYWLGRKPTQQIRDLLSKISPIERAAFVYTSDLYHLRKHNPGMVRTFLGKLSNKVSLKVEDPLTVIKGIDPEVMVLSHQICNRDIRGRGTKYNLMIEDGSIDYIVGTALNIVNTLTEYTDFIQAIFVSNNLPCTIPHIKNMMRRCVVLGDTDSTCSSQDEWIGWWSRDWEDWYGDNPVNNAIMTEEADGLSGSIMFIATKSLIHTLALFSANINVDKSKLHTLGMKSEYYWVVMAITNAAKHYHADKAIREANVYEVDDPDRTETKGVHLINSNGPPSIKKSRMDMITRTHKTLRENNNIRIYDYIQEIIDLERTIAEQIEVGSLIYYRFHQIKDKSAYKLGPTQSVYAHYLFWKEALEPVYGPITPPPYYSYKIPTTLVSRNKIKLWLDAMENRDLAERIAQWLDKYKKTAIKTLYLPVEFLADRGLPKEFTGIIDTMSTILDVCNGHYIFLESLGIYKKEEYLLTHHVTQT